MNIFVVRAIEELRGSRFLADFIESGDQPVTITIGEYANARKLSRKCLRAEAVGVEETPIEIKRAGEALENFAGSGFKAAAPKLHSAITSGEWFMAGPAIIFVLR
jgi:hypothetical protein